MAHNMSRSRRPTHNSEEANLSSPQTGRTNARGLPPHVQKQLLIDIEHYGGIRVPQKGKIYKTRKEYGAAGSALRQSVKSKVKAWKKLDELEYTKLLHSFKVLPSGTRSVDTGVGQLDDEESDDDNEQLEDEQSDSDLSEEQVVASIVKSPPGARCIRSIPMRPRLIQ
jgi:hypothetical protein